MLSGQVTVEKESDVFRPAQPESRGDLLEIDEVALHLAVKTAALAASFTTQWMTQQLCLPHRIVDEILWQLRDDKLLEMLGQTGPLTYQYRITNNGLDYSKRLMELCGYIGPTPVSLGEYTQSVLKQRQVRRTATLEAVRTATESLTLPDEILEIATLAFASNRSLFIFGPPGNGKSTLGRLLHQSVDAEIWVPHAISVDHQVVRFFDAQYHVRVDELNEVGNHEHDQRWLKIQRPFVVAGGELTMDQLDLVFDRSINYYEAPPHVKANCGTYFIDDLGRQRMPPSDLLNRWIVPLEHKIDYLSLINGKKIEIPFEMMLIVATNLRTRDVSDAAFLRRMGYRIHLDSPHETDFRIIFERQARDQNLSLEPKVIDHVIDRYRRENRPWRASEPRDLLIRCTDIIALHQREPRVDFATIDTAWTGYFSNKLDEA